MAGEKGVMIIMTKKTETVIKKYKALSDEEKYDFLKSLDQMGGIETYTVGSQIDEFIRFMEENDENEDEKEMKTWLCIADQEFCFLVKAETKEKADDIGYDWYSENIFEPGHWSVFEATEDNMKGIFLDHEDVITEDDV